MAHKTGSSRSSNQTVKEGSNAVSISIAAPDGVMPLSLGIEIPGGRSQHVIERGVRLPHQRRELYSTAQSYQTAAEFHLVLGERPLVQDNISLCRIRVRNVKWSGAGVPKIELVFDLDKQGRLSVSTDNKDRKRDEILVHNLKEQVSAEEVQAALDDAHQHAEKDDETRAAIQDMLDAYKLLDTAYEHYSLAKRKMSFFEQRGYKKIRGRVEAALRVMPPDITPASMRALHDAVEQLKVKDERLEQLSIEVAKWWK